MKIKINRLIQIDDGDRLSIVFAWMVLMLFLTNASGVAESITGVSYRIFSYFGKAIILFLILINIRVIVRNISPNCIAFLIALCIIFVLNFLLASENEYIKSTVFSFCMMVLPVIIVADSIRRHDILLERLKRVSIIIIVLAFFLLLTIGRNISKYSMGLSNSLVIPVLVLLLRYYYSRRLPLLILAVVGIIVIVMLGSRGSLLGIGSFTIALLLKGLANPAKRVRSFLLIVVVALAMIGYKQIIGYVVLLTDRLGIYSRTLYLLANDIHHDSGRNNIYLSILQELRINPLAMHGIAGEYSVTNGAYAHNFILELLIDFGVVFGGGSAIIILYNAFETIRTFVKEQSSYCDSKLILMAASLPMLFVSGTIWSSVYLWAWLFLRAPAVQDKEKRLII